MVGRKYSATISTTYRFGFNGQERSTELNSESYTAEFWQYDARIGRRSNIDPISNAFESPFSTFGGNPIWFSDPYGNTKDSGRTVGMNFVIVPSKAQRDLDIKSHGKLGSAYNQDLKAFKKMARKSKGEFQIIEADCSEDAVALIQKKLGANGFIKNLIIDFHKHAEGEGNEGTFTDSEGLLTNDAFASLTKLGQHYTDNSTKCYMGQCWAGGYRSMDAATNITESVSIALDGATVFGLQAGTSSFGLRTARSFTGMMFEEYGTNPADRARKKWHTVSFYNPALKHVVSVEIEEKIRFSNSGVIHTRYNLQMLQKLTSKQLTQPLVPFKINIPAPSVEELIPPPIEN